MTLSNSIARLAVVALFMISCGSGLEPEQSKTGTSQALLEAGNADCAHFCEALPPGPLRGECVSAAAQASSTGLCAQCQGNVNLICGLGPAGGVPGPTNATPFCCAPGSTCCGGVACANLQNDVLNCGACGHVCPAGNTCTSGRCCESQAQVCTGHCGLHTNSCGQVFDCGSCGTCFDTCQQCVSCFGFSCGFFSCLETFLCNPHSCPVH